MNIALSRTLVVIGIMAGAACDGPGPGDGADPGEAATTEEGLAATVHSMPCDGKLYRFPVSSDHFIPGNPYVMYWETNDPAHPSDSVDLVAWRLQN